MNKKIALGILIIYLLVNCKSKQQVIQIIQKTTDYPITLRLSHKYTKVIGIKFPQRINIKNNTTKRESFVKIDYEYNSIPKERSYGLSLFTEKNNSLVKISNNKKKAILPNNNREYIFYTRHFVDSISSIQNELKPYITKMLELGQDTLAIGTIAEFKTKHNDLLKKLTKDDSISIRFLNNNKLGKRISVPVKW